MKFRDTDKTPAAIARNGNGRFLKEAFV
jgi:hypothetical protein